MSVGSDQAISTAGGKNRASVHTGGAPASCTCQLPFPVLVNSPIEAPRLAVHPVTATAASKPSQPSIPRLAMIVRILALNPQLIYRRRNLRVSCADLDTEPDLANGCGSPHAKQLL